MLFKRFPTLTPEDIMVIAGIPSSQLQHTRAAQDLIEKGRQEGRANEAAAVTLRLLTHPMHRQGNGTSLHPIDGPGQAKLKSLTDALSKPACDRDPCIHR